MHNDPLSLRHPGVKKCDVIGWTKQISRDESEPEPRDGGWFKISRGPEGGVVANERKKITNSDTKFHDSCHPSEYSESHVFEKKKKKSRFGVRNPDIIFM